MPDFPLDTGLTIDGAWAWLPLLPLLVWLAHAIYARTRPTVAPARLRTLWLLRSAVLSVLLLLLVEPLLAYVTRRAERPVLVTLVDTSASMAVQEGDSTRWQRVQAALSGTLGAALLTDPVMVFADQVEPVQPDSLPTRIPAGLATDLAAAMEAASRVTSGQRRASGMVLLSDGGHNLGADPVATARELGLPLYVLGVGSRRRPDDVQVAVARAPGPAFAGQPVVLDVELRAWGYADQSVDVRVEEEGHILTRQAERLGTQGQTRSLPVRLPPLDPGPHLLRVTAAALPGELTLHNNSALVFLRVRQARLRVLLVGGGPNPEVAFLRRLLSADSTLALSLAIRRDDGSTYQGLSLPPSQGWSAWDAVLLVDPGTDSGADGLSAYVTAGGGLLLLAGGRTPLSRLGPLRSLLPLASPVTAVGQPGRKALEVDPAGSEHPLGRVLSAGRGAGDPWQRLPPLVLRYSPLRAAPASTPLLRSASADPVVVATTSGRGRILAAFGTGFWRLSLFSRAGGEGTDVVGEFWRQAVRWLALASPTGRVRVSAGRPVYRAGQPVEVTAEVYDELSEPLSGARVVLQAAGVGEVAMDPQAAGRYRAFLRGLPPGVHHLQVRARMGGTDIGQAQGQVAVETHTVEANDLRANPALLAAVARASGGDYRPLERWREMADRLNPPPSLVRLERRLGIDVAQTPWFFVLVVLLGTEWILRRRGGML